MRNLGIKGVIFVCFLSLPSIGFSGVMEYLCGMIQPNGMLKATSNYIRELAPSSGGQQVIKSSNFRKLSREINLKLKFETPEINKKMSDADFIKMLQQAQKQTKKGVGLCYHGPVKGNTLVVRDIED